MLLFINGCMRGHSRTLELAEAVLSKANDEIERVNLDAEGPDGLSGETLSKRDSLIKAEDFSNPMFDHASKFSAADEIVLAAPYWDLMFPSKVRAYLEAVTVSNITFRYNQNGIPEGLCRAKRLIYVTTSGGPIHLNFGFDYVKALCQTFYGIQDVRLVKAEGLDIRGADQKAIMKKAISEIPGILRL